MPSRSPTGTPAYRWWPLELRNGPRLRGDAVALGGWVGGCCCRRWRRGGHPGGACRRWRSPVVLGMRSSNPAGEAVGQGDAASRETRKVRCGRPGSARQERSVTRALTGAVAESLDSPRRGPSAAGGAVRSAFCRTSRQNGRVPPTEPEWVEVVPAAPLEEADEAWAVWLASRGLHTGSLPPTDVRIDTGRATYGSFRRYQVRARAFRSLDM